MVVVSSLHVVVGASSVVVVIKRPAPGLPRLVAASEKKRKMGEKREQSNHEYSSKVLASKDLRYICMGICVKGHIGGLNCRMPE